MAQPTADDLDELVEVGEELLDRHRRPPQGGVVRVSGAALIPVDDGEALLQDRVAAAEERGFRHARSTVEQDEDWIRDVLAADHDPLIDPTEAHVSQIRNAAGEWCAVRTAKLWRTAFAFHDSSS